MPFPSGSLAFRRFSVCGKAPSIDEDLLQRLVDHAIRESEFGIDEIQYGWCGGRHVLDGSFSFEHNVFNDCLHFALRIDINKVPSELKRAWQLMEEDAAAKNNPSGFVSKLQKRQAKDIVQRKVDEELRSGRFTRSKLVPVLWDVPAGVVYCNAGMTATEQLLEIFERTFDLALLPLSSGTMALRTVEAAGKRRDYEDATPTRFVRGPEGENQPAEYPWVAKGPEAKDFLGNEFLLWLWHEADVHGGYIKTEAGELAILFDRMLDLDCVFGATGRDTLKGDGVARMPEAIDALRSGKVPRKAGLVLDAFGHNLHLTLAAETLGVNGLKLPEVQGDTPRVVFEERIGVLRDFSRALDALYATFLKLRLGAGWETQVGNIRRWIARTSKPVAAVA